MVTVSVPNDSFRCPQPVHMTPPLNKQVATITKSEQCQADGLSSEWNVRRTMRESSVESLLKSATACEDSNFDLRSLRRLCLIRDNLDLKSHLGAIEQVDDDF
ncbi:hypothetical protein GCK32_021559 [Trichostrongylus colubriformis]|uniref:Uncharacterized protein n=1 Tax=Trichostrongylus colubriformis TaxID=6319 RepID=A0AAN8F0I9_TRICO